MSFGMTLKQLRKERNMTQDQLANLLNVTPQAVSRWENNAAMPDISLLVPLANIFHVSTDKLLGVDVEKNEEVIKDLVLHSVIFTKPYGSTLSEKLELYREKVRQFPESATLKEALLIVLSLKETSEGAYPDLALYREMAELTEDILESGGGSLGISHHKSQLVYFLKKLNNSEQAEKIANNSGEMEICREMILPSALTGRKQVDARKDLIYQCVNAIIHTIWDLYDENADDLTDEEWDALVSAEGIIATVYGKSFDNHFALLGEQYKGVKGALKRGRREEAIHRLQRIVKRLKLQETESAQISPLALEQHVENLYLTHLTLCKVSWEAKLMMERIERDFLHEGAPDYKTEYPQFNEAYEELKRLSKSDGGQMDKDAHAALRRMWEKAHPEGAAKE